MDKKQPIQRAAKIALLIAGLFLLGAQTAIDGDTFQHGSHRIRLWGIDTPEKDEPGYEAAARHLQKLMSRDKPVCKIQYRDRYGRAVAKCAIGKKDLGREMVAAGYARDYTRYSQGHYLSIENKARLDETGFWGNIWRK